MSTVTEKDVLIEAAKAVKNGKTKLVTGKYGPDSTLSGEHCAVGVIQATARQLGSPGLADSSVELVKKAVGENASLEHWNDKVVQANPDAVINAFKGGARLAG